MPNNLLQFSVIPVKPDYEAVAESIIHMMYDSAPELSEVEMLGVLEVVKDAITEASG